MSRVESTLDRMRNSLEEIKKGLASHDLRFKMVEGNVKGSGSLGVLLRIYNPALVIREESQVSSRCRTSPYQTPSNNEKPSASMTISGGLSAFDHGLHH